MKVNPNLKLILKNCYLYDIESCHYTIMKNMGMDMSEINKEDKLERNTQIGKMMRKNPKLTSLLRNTTNSIIDTYINENGITEDDIILRQYDGIIITKTLRKTNIGDIPLNVRKQFLVFISSFDRKYYIALTSDMKIVAKGISNRYRAMDDVYRKICQIIDTGKKESYFRQLQRLKDDFMTTDYGDLFGVPSNEEHMVNVFLKNYGQIKMSKQTLRIMDLSDIDREKYFNHYIVPFTKSIVVEYVR